MECIFCHTNFDSSENEGNAYSDYTCNKCHVWFMWDHESESFEVVEFFSVPGEKKSFCIQVNVVRHEIYFGEYGITIPMTWVFPSTIQSLLNRVENLMVFL